MNANDFIAARKQLGLSRPEMAVALRLRGDFSVKTIERIENGAPITGPMSLAVEKLLDDHAALTTNGPL